MKRIKFVKPPSKTVIAGIMGAVCGLASISASAGIENSRHDLRTFLGGATAEICVVCHTPHDADGNTATGVAIGAAPLWNHTVTTAAFTMYSAGGSTTLDGVEDAEPTGASKLCLSCHDGTVAIDSFGGGAGTGNALDPLNPYFVGTDLQGQHPISITYADTIDPGLWAQDTSITIGGYPNGGTPFPTRTGTIGELLVPDGKVQCSSCHDVHNTLVATPQAMLRVSNVGSGLCLTCHNK